MKIGIYGGSFNPPHNGHMNILKGFNHSLNLDKTIVIPTNVSPHKTQDFVASGDERLKMCELAIKDSNINAEVSSIEIDRGNKSYTIYTLKDFKKIYPKSELYFLVGEDMFFTIHNWFMSEEIFKLATICCAKRNNNSAEKIISFAENLKVKFPSFKYKFVDVEYLEMSSTQIRNGDLSGVSKSVANYILNNNLYFDWRK